MKEILNSARQASGMPHEPMTKEEKELALQAELDILKKMKEDRAKREREEAANRCLGDYAKSVEVQRHMRRLFAR